MSSSRRAVLWLLLVSLIGAAFAFTVTSPSEVAGITFPSPEISCLTEKQTIEGPVIYADELPVDTLNNESIRYDGYIVFVGTGRVEVSFTANGDWELYRWKRRGAIGVVIVNSVTPEGGGGESLLPGWSICSELPPLMGYEVGFDVGKNVSRMIASYQHLRIRLTPGDVNPWREIRRSWYSYFFRVVFALASGFTSALAISKLVAYVRRYGIQLSVPQFCLSITAVVALFRTVYHALDPIYFGYLFTASQAHSMSTISFPADLITTLLVSLYWSELLHRSKLNVSQFLSKFRWVFWTVSFLAIGLEVTSTVFRATGGSLAIFTTIVAVVYVVVSVGMTILFFYNGIKVLQYVRQSDRSANVHQRRRSAKNTLRRASILIVTSGIFNLVWVAGLGMAAISSFFWTAMGQHITWTTMWVGVTGATLSQVLAFKMPVLTPGASTTKGTISGTGTGTNTTGSGSGHSASQLVTTHTPSNSTSRPQIDDV